VDLVKRLPSASRVIPRGTRRRFWECGVGDNEDVESVFAAWIFITGAKGKVTVNPPSFRFDLEIEEDLIEEVARVHGFDNIPANPPLAVAQMRVRPEVERSLHAVRERIAACDSPGDDQLCLCRAGLGGGLGG
jgi:phenylalanyl-tRNA synthetase beta chain